MTSPLRVLAVVGVLAAAGGAAAGIASHHGEAQPPAPAVTPTTLTDQQIGGAQPPAPAVTPTTLTDQQIGDICGVGKAWLYGDSAEDEAYNCADDLANQQDADGQANALDNQATQGDDAPDPGYVSPNDVREWAP